MSSELRSTVPPVGCPLEHTTEPRLSSIEGLLKQIVVALGAEQLRSPGLPPGMLQRQDAQENQLADHEERLTTVENSQTKTGDRWITLALDLAKAIGGGVIGAFMAIKGGHQ